ncbi:anti-repressor SinI family protein [Niallia oryzisoli]|uniref:Anti-repressor SinI family protein n=1 Tax=Niallia oryzisoli TaxID=1737571 RepID=A0ABZ2CG36_9BACI
MSEGKEQSIEYDIEWIELITEAKNLGIEMEEIRNFFAQSNT